MSSAHADAQARAEVIYNLIRELSGTLEWRYGPETDPEEVASLDQVVAQARAHQMRMDRRYITAEEIR